MKPTALITAAVLALSTVPVFAQPPPMGGEAGAPQPGYGRGMGGQRRAQMIADVHTILHIRPDQEQAFQAFMAALHRPRAPLPNAATGNPPPPPSPPPEIEADYQSFSAVLTPDQQQVLAALRRLALDRPRWGGMRHGMGGPTGAPPPEGEPQ